jgi:hypothetical protein
VERSKERRNGGRAIGFINPIWGNRVPGFPRVPC